MSFFRILCQGWQVAKLGSNANNSVKAGVFYLNVNNDLTNDNSNIGSHLCLFFKNIWHKILASRQNTKQSLIQFGRLILEQLEVK